jgi:ribosomal protein S18 acetylase RimI-like enzyme
MPPHIRTAVSTDIRQVKHIRETVTENTVNPARVSDTDYEWFVEHGPIWVCESDAEILGFSAGDPRDGSIWALFVHPDREGRGIGSALLARACASLSAAGYATATLDTEPGTRAAEFYRRQGWTEMGLNTSGQMLFTRSLAPHSPGAHAPPPPR